MPEGLAPYGTGEWDRELGNHRAVVTVEEEESVVNAHVPWRLPGPFYDHTEIVVVDAESGRELEEVAVHDCTQASGDVVFHPASGPGTYYIYYLVWPDETTWPHPDDVISGTVPTTDPTSTEWLADYGIDLGGAEAIESLPIATVERLDARTEYDRFDPMQVIAIDDEVTSLLADDTDAPYLTFPEDRRHPTKMVEHLPHRWIERGPATEFSGTALRNEYYVFQIPLFAHACAIVGVDVVFEPLVNGEETVPASEFCCFNLGGTGCFGEPIEREVTVEEGRVLPLWIGVQIPEGAAPGTYEGAVTVAPGNAPDTRIDVTLDVERDILDDGGVEDGWRLARLKWLDSTLGAGEDPVDPYVPLSADGRTVSCLGRSVEFAPTGLPAQVTTAFGADDRRVLASPAKFVVEQDGTIETEDASSEITRETKGTATVEGDVAAGGVELAVRGRMEFDGHLDYEVTVTATENVSLNDVRLELPFRKEIATYAMGMGHQGGHRPANLTWEWREDRTNNQLWIGDVDAGLYCKLKARRHQWNSRSLWNTGVPEAWDNAGRGGAELVEEDGSVVFRAFSGPRNLSTGETVTFNFALLGTPVKDFDPGWDVRKISDPSVAYAKEHGANVVHLHHANDKLINPFINYPFTDIEAMDSLVDDVHANDMALQFYYTVRVLSARGPEIWPFLALGDEIVQPRGPHHRSIADRIAAEIDDDGLPDGPERRQFLHGLVTPPWLREHLDDYESDPKWTSYSSPDAPGGKAYKHSDESLDVTVETQYTSRFNNFYVASAAWLMERTGFEGIYVDEFGHPREVTQRLRRAMAEHADDPFLDFHSHRHFDPAMRTGEFCPATEYLEHFPYVDRLFFGENFDYDADPDYWLVEVSGIPFGLPNDMLEDGGNQWRGMLYGMTKRPHHWRDGPKEADPSPIWEFWDEFGIQKADMFGYWDPTCPVEVDHPNLRATAYRKDDATLVAVASWADEAVDCRLNVEWSGIGLDPDRATVEIPRISGFQPGERHESTEGIVIPAGEGRMLILKEE